MTIWIRWNSSVEAAFRARYLEVTGEAIQEGSGSSENIGSSRITPEQQETLSVEFGDNISFHMTK